MAIIGVLNREGYTANLNAPNTFKKAQRGEVVTIDIIGGEATIDFDDGNYFEAVEVTESFTLLNPINAIKGQSGTITIIQDSSGGNVVAFGDNWKFAGGIIPDISTDPNSVSIFAYYIFETDQIFLNLSGIDIDTGV